MSIAVVMGKGRAMREGRRDESEDGGGGTARAVYVVSVRIREDAVAEYERFERAAAAAMTVHGGRIERVLRREHPAEEGGDEPFEVHLISFPDAAAFHAYRTGEAAAALRPLRERVIERTTVFAARDHPPPEPAEHEPGAG